MAIEELRERLTENIAALRKEFGDTVDIGEVSGLVESLLADGWDNQGQQVSDIQREITGLVAYIQEAKAEISQIGSAVINGGHLPDANDELGAVVKSTEEAANKILDSAEELESIVADLDGEIGERVTKVAVDMYEALSFQDLTGQRISKVVTLLADIESRIHGLVNAVTMGAIENGQAGKAGRPLKNGNDEGLLNGPQMPDVANQQGDIDALMASFD